jgi:hypothetical protein
MKSNRIKRPANRDPTSLAIATSIWTRVPLSSPDLLQTDAINLQLLEHDLQLPNKAIINTVEELELDTIELDSTELAPSNNDIPSDIQTRQVSSIPEYNPTTDNSQVPEELDNKDKAFQ